MRSGRRRTGRGQFMSPQYEHHADSIFPHQPAALLLHIYLLVKPIGLGFCHFCCSSDVCPWSGWRGCCHRMQSSRGCWGQIIVLTVSRNGELKVVLSSVSTLFAPSGVGYSQCYIYFQYMLCCFNACYCSVGFPYLLAESEMGWRHHVRSKG